MADPWGPSKPSLTPEEYFGRVKQLYPNARFTGGGRTPARNREVGGVPNSMHLSNQALDFDVPGVPHHEITATLRANGLPMTEAIPEGRRGNQGQHEHVGWGGAEVTPPSDPWGPKASTDPWSPTKPTPPTRKPGATGLGMVGELFGDLTHSGPADHDPNAIEQGIMGVADHPLVRSAVANYKSAVMHGVFAEPTRAVMEGVGYDRRPGETDAQFHNRYNQAIIQGRQKAAEEAANSRVGDGQQTIEGLVSGKRPNPTLGDRALRLGQQTINVGANVVANPQYFLLPGMGVGSNAAMRIGTAGAGNAAVGGVSDAAAQLMDVAAGVQKDFDIKQNLEATLLSGAFGAGLHGAVEVAPFVKGLFSTRGMDTTPVHDPRTSNITPQTTDHIPLNQADDAQYRQLLQSGSVDDIKAFFQGRNGPQPSWRDVNTWVEHRDGSTRTGPVQETVKPNFNYADEYNAQAETKWREENRTAVEDHINAQMTGWRNAPEVEVVHEPADIADPKIRKAVMKDDKNGDALGFLGADGKVRVFSSRITDPDTASAVLFHEGLGHHGLAVKFGARLDQTIQALLDRNVSQFSRAVDAWQKANPKAYKGNRIRAAEEVLAEASQNGRIKASWQNAVTSAVRQFGRKMGLKLGYSDAEVNHILAMSHDAVINGHPDAVANGFRGATQSPNKFMFTGQRAKGFDPESPTAFRANDGELRNEISDENARLHENPGNTLGETLDHPELYEQYPELRRLPVIRQHMDDLAGVYDTGAEHPLGRHIMLNPKDPDALSTTLHETQHGIQDIEQRPDFVRAAKQGGTAGMDESEYFNHPSEVEARATEARRTMTSEERAANHPKFMRTDQLGREVTPTEHLDEIDRLKANPRFWTDPEFRANIIELARAQQPIEHGSKSELPKSSGFRSEAEARAAQAKFITKSQLASQKGYRADDLEGIYNALDEGYTPTVRTWEQERQTALDAGFTPSQIKAMKALSPGELSARMWRLQSAANMADAKISELNERLDTPEWSAKDQAEYIKVIADRDYLVTRIKGDRAEIARAQNVARAAGSYNKTTMEQMHELLEQEGSGLAGLAMDPTAFLKFARKVKTLMAQGNPKGAHSVMQLVNKPYWEQYLTSFHYNAMLSGLSTHVKAPLDMMTGIAHSIIDHTLAMPIGKIANVLEGLTGQTIKPGISSTEVAGRLYGITRTIFDHEVYTKTLEAFRTGEGHAVMPGGKSIPTNPHNTYLGAANPRLGLLSKPSDLIVAEDTYFRSVSMSESLYGLGMREAEAQLKAAKAPYTRDDVFTLGSSIAHNPSPSMVKEALAVAERALLLNPNKLTSWIDKVKSIGPGASASERLGSFLANNLAPFIRVAANSLLTRVIARSPLQLLSSATRKTLAAGGPEAHLVIARIAYGTVKLGILWAMADAAKNLVTGEGPTNPLKRKELEASGWRRNATYENGQYNTGGTLAMSLNPFDTHNSTAQMVAAMRQAYDRGANKGQIGVGLKLALGSILRNFESQTWVDSIAPAVAAASADGGAGAKVNQFVAEEAKSWVPNILGQVSRMTNPNRVDTRVKTDDVDPTNIAGSAINSVQSAIPGLNSKLPTQYSVYGNPIPTGQSVEGVHTMIPGLGGNHVKETTDPTELELNRLARLTEGAIITPVLRSVKLEDGSTKRLTAAEFQEYQRLAGRAIVQEVATEMSHPEWEAMSDEDKILIIRDIQTDMKKAAREALFYGPE